MPEFGCVLSLRGQTTKRWTNAADLVVCPLSFSLGNADLRAKLAQQDIDVEGSAPEQFSAMLKQEIARWEKLIKAAGIRGE